VTLSSYLYTVSQVLRFEHEPWRVTEPWTALLTVALAALSMQMGHSVVLFLSRVRARRFLLSLLVGSLFHVVALLLWSLLIYLSLSLTGGRDVALQRVLSLVGLAQMPHLLSVLSFAPLFGLGIAWLLGLWSLLLTAFALQVGLDLTPFQAVLSVGGGWVFMWVFQRTLGVPLATLVYHLEARIAGVAALETTLSAARLLEVTAEERG
jgi:hypothetical protein